MAGIFAFTCNCCGNIHEGSPSFAYDAPYYYAQLSDEQKRTIAKIDSDRCTITHPEGTQHFIRCVLDIPIHGIEDPFTWGIWVSVSEKSFARYSGTCDETREGDGFFGWFANALPCYPSTLALPSNVNLQPGNQRPTVHLHQSHDHQLMRDQRDGISVALAQAIAETVSHPPKTANG